MGLTISYVGEKMAGTQNRVPLVKITTVGKPDLGRGRTPNPSTGLSGVAEFAAAHLGLGPQHVRCFGTGTTPTSNSNQESRIQPAYMKNPTPQT